MIVLVFAGCCLKMDEGGGGSGRLGEAIFGGVCVCESEVKLGFGSRPFSCWVYLRSYTK